MPARPAMLDTITEKVKQGTISDVVAPVCCFFGCKKKAVAFVVVRFKTGATDLYGVCTNDLVKVKEAADLGRTTQQGVFLYP